MIHKVKLHNFRSHTHNEVPLPSGVCAISGPVGAGKSSVLNAIGLAIFGYIPEGVSANEWVKHGEKEAVIEVTFGGKDGLPYTVWQKIPRSGTRKMKVLDKDGRELVTHKLDEAYDLVRELLGIGKNENLRDLFNHFIGVPQRELVGVFDLQPGPRAQILDHAFGLESYRQAAGPRLGPLRDAANQARNQLELEQQNLIGQAQNKPQIEKERADAETARKEAEKRVTDTAPKLEAAKKQLDVFTLQEKAVRDAEIAHGRKENQVKLAETKEGAAKEKLAEAQKASKFVESNEPKWKRLAGLDEELTKTEQERRKLDAEARPLRAKEKQVTGKREQVRTIQQRADQAQEALKRKADVQRWEAAQEGLAARDERLRARRATFDQAKTRFQSEKERIRELEPTANKFENLEKKFTELEPLVAGLAALGKAYETAQTEASAANTRVQELDRSLKTLQKGRCPVMAVSCPVVKDDPEKATGNQLLVLQKANKDAERDTDNARKALETSKKSQEQLDSVKSELREARNAQRDLLAARDRLSKIGFDPELEAPLKEDERTLKEEQREHQKVAKEMHQLRALIDDAEPARKALKEAKESLDALLAETKPLAGLEERIAKAQESVDKLTSQIQALDGFRHDYKAAVNLAGKLVDLEAAHDAARKTLLEDQKLLVEAAKIFKAARDAYDDKAHDKARGHYEQLREIVVAAKQEQTTQAGIVSAKAKQLEGIAKIEKRLKELEGEVDHAVGVVEFLKDFKGMLLDAANKMAEHLTRGVARHATRYYRSINGNENKELVFGEKYELIVRDGANETKFRSLSGGEQVSSAVSVRLALIRNIKNFEFAFFDEPTQNMDVPSRRQLAHLLTHAEESFKQLVVISHSDEFDSDTGYVIRVKPSAAGSVIA